MRAYVSDRFALADRALSRWRRPKPFDFEQGKTHVIQRVQHPQQRSLIGTSPVNVVTVAGPPLALQ